MTRQSIGAISGGWGCHLSLGATSILGWLRLFRTSNLVDLLGTTCWKWHCSNWGADLSRPGLAEQNRGRSRFSFEADIQVGPGSNGATKRDHLTGVAMDTRKKAKKAAKKKSGKPAPKKVAPAPAKKAANGPLKKFAAAVKKAAKRIGIGGGR